MRGLSSNLDRVTATKIQNMMLANANTMVVEDANFKPWDDEIVHFYFLKPHPKMCM